MVARKPKAKRAAPKGKAKPAKKATRAKTKLKAKPTAKAKPKGKPAAKPAKKRRAVAAVAPPPPPEPVSTEVEIVEEMELQPAKKGPLARLAGGVGNLFARVTGIKARPPEPSDQTMEIASTDILLEMPAPPPVPKPKS